MLEAEGVKRGGGGEKSMAPPAPAAAALAAVAAAAAEEGPTDSAVCWLICAAASAWRDADCDMGLWRVLCVVVLLVR